MRTPTHRSLFERAPTTDVGEFVSVGEAVRVAGMTRQNIHYLIKTGKLRAGKVKDRWVVAKAEVESYAAEAPVRKL
jgi:hypothetical protein